MAFCFLRVGAGSVEAMSRWIRGGTDEEKKASQSTAVERDDGGLNAGGRDGLGEQIPATPGN